MDELQRSLENWTSFSELEAFFGSLVGRPGPWRAVRMVPSCATGWLWPQGCWSVCASPAWCLVMPLWCLCWRMMGTSASCASATSLLLRPVSKRLMDLTAPVRKWNTQMVLKKVCRVKKHKNQVFKLNQIQLLLHWLCGCNMKNTVKWFYIYIFIVLCKDELVHIFVKADAHFSHLKALNRLKCIFNWKIVLIISNILISLKVTTIITTSPVNIWHVTD